MLDTAATVVLRGRFLSGMIYSGGSDAAVLSSDAPHVMTY